MTLAWTDDGVLCERGCDRVHQPRERKVPCSDCGSPTEDVHGVCDDCWLAGLELLLQEGGG